MQIKYIGTILAILFLTIPASASATVVFLTSGTSWTRPADWNSAANTIECIGGGGGGGTDNQGSLAGGAGGGGAYSKAVNQSPGATVPITIGAGGGNATAGGTTSFGSMCVAAGGGAGQNYAGGGGAGGAASAGTGSVKYSGGNGLNGAALLFTGGGGGGAAGPNGNGNPGYSNGSDVYGGSADAGLGGAGGGPGGAGSAGNEWDTSHGSGGGGGRGGATAYPAPQAPSGGLYGGGGGGGSTQGGTGGMGAQGLIVITYTPHLPSASRNLTVNDTVSVAGNVTVVANLAKGSGTFLIDHPVDPANKLLYHSFVESPDALNEYVGTAIVGKDGDVTIRLPEYFEALNGKPQYFIRALDMPMPNLFVKQEVKDNRFVVGGGSPGGEISWMVTGIRHDPYILANPIIPEVEKGPDQLVDKGEYVFEGNAPTCTTLFNCVWAFVMRLL